MKQTEEFEGKNIEQAIENACSSLNLAKKNLKYDVISSGSSGIFGIVGVKKARIRVEISAKKQSAHEENKKNMNTHDSNGVMSIVDEAFGEKKNIPDKVSKDLINLTDAKKDKAADNKTADNKTADNKTADKKTADKKTADKKTADKKINSKIEPAAIETDELNNKNTDFSDNENTDSFNGKKQTDSTWDEGFPPIYMDDAVADVSEESIVLGKNTLQKMVDFITTDAVVTAETRQDKLLLKIEGGNSGVLIGRRGQTLEAMQFLTDKIINRKSESRVRLKVDIEGYMETRKANLKSLAFKMANKAKKTGRPATINQMTAQDRRIVHLALKDDSRVRTQSVGDGYYRRLVIFPKKTSYRRNNQARKK